jgi:hypothetical protein
MIPTTPFAWRQLGREASVSTAFTRRSSNAGKGPPVRPGPASTTPVTSRHLWGQPPHKRNRSCRRSHENPRVAMIPTTPFAWRQLAREAPVSTAFTRRSSNAGKGPSVRPGPASITPVTCRQLCKRPRRKPNQRRRPNERSQRRQRDRRNHRRHRDLHYRSSTELPNPA